MRKTLGRRVVTGVGWTLASAITVRFMQFLVTIVLARLLAPKAFGLFALGQLFITAVALFRDLGFGQALIYHKNDVQKNAETTLIINTLFGLAAFGLTYLASPLISHIFGGKPFIWPLRVMSFSIVISSLGTVPAILLEKELEFRRRAMPEFATGLTYAAVSIILALRGFGVWSLIIGHLASTTANAIVAWLVAGWKPSASFHAESAKNTLKFGRPLMAASVLFLAFFYIDNAAIGRWLGVTALGYYSLAYTVCNLPATNITHVVNKVMFPAYSKMNNDIAALRQAYIRTVKSISLVSFPIAIWLSVAANDFVVGFFSPKWHPAIMLFRVLAFYGMFRSVGATAGSVFMAIGEPKWVYRLNFLQITIALPLVYPVTVHYGTFGVAVLFTFAYIVGTSMALWKVLGLLQMPIREYLGVFRVPTLASCTILVSYFLASLIIPQGTARAIITALVSALAYVLATVAMDRNSFKTAQSLLLPKQEKVYADLTQGKSHPE